MLTSFLHAIPPSMQSCPKLFFLSFDGSAVLYININCSIALSFYIWIPRFALVLVLMFVLVLVLVLMLVRSRGMQQLLAFALGFLI